MIRNIINLFRKKKPLEPIIKGQKWGGCSDDEIDNPFRKHSIIVEIKDYKNGWVNYKWIKIKKPDDTWFKPDALQDESMIKSSFRYCYKKISD